MKYQIKFILALLIIISSYSCSSDFEEVDLTTQEPQSFADLDGIQVLEYANPSTKGFRIRNNNTTFLSFPNLDVFQKTIKLLEARAEFHDNQFIAAHANLNADQLSDLESQIGFNLYDPLEKFASDYGFKDTMLKDYINAENNWLGHQTLDIDNDPDKQFFYLDEEELAVLNKDAVVKVGNSIYKVIKGGYIEITDGNLQTLAAINNLNRIDPCAELLSIQDYSNVNVVSGCSDGGGDWDPYPAPGSCYTQGSARNHWTLDGNRMIKGEVVLRVGDFFSKRQIKSKTKYFKKGWTGIWGRHRSDLVAALDGKFDTEYSECGDLAYEFNEKIHRTSVFGKSKAKYKVSVNGGYQGFKVQNGRIKGFHYEKSNLRTQNLTF